MKTEDIKREIESIFSKFGLSQKLQGDLVVTTPLTGDKMFSIAADDTDTVDSMIEKSVTAQEWWKEDRGIREEFLGFLAGKIAEYANDLAKLVHYDSGKSIKESAIDVTSTVALITNTLKAAAYEPLPGGAERGKEYTPLGVILIIEPFNFFSIKLWTGIPALLAGNTVVCKASENVSLPTILFGVIVSRAIKEFNAQKNEDLVPENIFQVALGGPEVGKAMVADKRVAKVVVTGSIGVCEKVKEMDGKISREAKALTEGGAANFVIVSNNHEGMTRQEYLRFVVGAVLKSVLPYASQKCIGSRLLVVHDDLKDDFVGELRNQLDTFRNNWRIENAFSEDNPFEFAPLINQRAGERFQWALQQAREQGGDLTGGERLGGNDYPNAHYYMPALGIFKTHVSLLNEEIFGPFIALISYSGGVNSALSLAQKPNAKLVNAYYGSDEQEAKLFKRKNQAGFSLINTPQGTGLLPPYGLGFGGNGLSGQGESFARDPESLFVKPDGDIKRYVSFKLPVAANT